MQNVLSAGFVWDDEGGMTEVMLVFHQGGCKITDCSIAGRVDTSYLQRGGVMSEWPRTEVWLPFILREGVWCQKDPAWKWSLVTLNHFHHMCLFPVSDATQWERGSRTSFLEMLRMDQKGVVRKFGFMTQLWQQEGLLMRDSWLPPVLF